MPHDFSEEINAAFAAFESERAKLVALPPPSFLCGPYFQPHVEIGDEVRCQRYGLVRVTGWSGGPLPWPQCRIKGPHSLILFADLERAIRNESSIAVAVAWGTSRITIWKCRQALGLASDTAGTTARRAHICDTLFRGDENSDRRANPRRGAQKKRAATGQNNGAASLEWEPEVVEWMGALSDREIARRLGIAPQKVARERGRRGIAPLDWGGARQNDLCPIDGARIADRRRTLDLTQVQIGARVERKQGYISQLESGHYPRITRSMFEALARALECQPDDLRPLDAATSPDTL